MEELTKAGSISPKEIALIRTTVKNLVPDNIVFFEDLVGASPKYCEPEIDPSLSPYLKAKMYIFSGRYDSALQLLRETEPTASGPMTDFYKFWIARCCINVGNYDSAQEEIQALPPELQERFPSELRGGFPHHTPFPPERGFGFAINISFANNVHSVHVLNRDNGDGFTVFIEKDGSILLNYGSDSILYPSMKEFEEDNPDVFEELFGPK